MARRKETMYLLAREIIENAMYKGVPIPFDAVELVESAKTVSDLKRLNKMIKEYEPGYGYTMIINYFDRRDSKGRLKRRIDFDSVYIVPRSEVEPYTSKELREARLATNREIIMGHLEKTLEETIGKKLKY